ncbi:MAG: (2Fe-2S)-binding protein [Desulfobacula sp.]|nr:(2Fe-2S)-binding protein [Desulfobacula sp.]
MKLSFTLNHNALTLETEPDRRVIDLLREDLGLTGTKEACGEGECGACTIRVNKELRLACLMIAAQIEGCSIETIEGLAGPDQALHPVQEAFVQAGAVQCGFCTPGMVMAVTDLLEAIPDPDETQIRKALSGNLCRCTGYQKIMDAAQLAAKKENKCLP